MSLLDIRKRKYGYNKPYLSHKIECCLSDPINELYEQVDDLGRPIDDVAKYLNVNTDIRTRTQLESNLRNMFPPKSQGFDNDDDALDNMLPNNLSESQLEEIVDNFNANEHG